MSQTSLSHLSARWAQPGTEKDQPPVVCISELGSRTSGGESGSLDVLGPPDCLLPVQAWGWGREGAATPSPLAHSPVLPPPPRPPLQEQHPLPSSLYESGLPLGSSVPWQTRLWGQRNPACFLPRVSPWLSRAPFVAPAFCQRHPWPQPAGWPYTEGGRPGVTWSSVLGEGR